METMEKIDIRDLSIGDWVRYDNGVTPYSIRSIVRTGDQECVVLKDDMYPDGITGFVKYLKPIPITPEILEKNGFVYSKVTRWYSCELKDTQRTRIGVHFFGGVANRIEISSVDALDEDWNTIDVMINKPIKGVHQLQHALRLAGVEKEITI